MEFSFSFLYKELPTNDVMALVWEGIGDFAMTKYKPFFHVTWRDGMSV